MRDTIRHVLSPSYLSTSSVVLDIEQDLLERSRVLHAALPPHQQRTINGIVDGNASGWLTVLSLGQEGYDMELNDLPSHCDGCGAAFSLQLAWAGLY